MKSTRRLRRKPYLLFQAAVIFLGAALGLFWRDVVAISYLVGGFVMFCANFAFLLRLFFQNTFFSPLKELMILYLSEFSKLIIVVLGTLMVVIINLHASQTVLYIPYVIGLIALQLSLWTLPFFMQRCVLTRRKIPQHVERVSL